MWRTKSASRAICSSVRTRASKKAWGVLGPAPLVEAVVEEHQEPQLFGDDVVRDAAGPEFVAMSRQELVPLVSATTKRHAKRLRSVPNNVLSRRMPFWTPDHNTCAFNSA